MRVRKHRAGRQPAHSLAPHPARALFSPLTEAKAARRKKELTDKDGSMQEPRDEDYGQWVPHAAPGETQEGLRCL